MNRETLRAETISETSEELIGILRNTVFGTEGKLRYRQKEIEKGLRLLKGLEFIQVKKGERILATAGVIKRATHELDTLYIRYLSAVNPFRSRNKMHPEKGALSRSGRLRTAIGKIFTDYFERSFHDNDQSGCFYAYVESDNVYSHNMCLSFGFKPVRELQTMVFSRFFPKPEASVREVSGTHHSVYLDEVHSFYKDHAFVFTHDIGDRGRLYGWYEGEELVAGIRAWPVRWELVEVPGFTGFLMQKVLPYLPLTRRLFNPDDMHFLAFDMAWYKEGYEPCLPRMMQHVCAEHQIHMGMITGDAGSRLIQNLKSTGKPGLLHRINGAVSAEVMVRPINMSDEEFTRLVSKPVFVSAVDMT